MTTYTKTEVLHINGTSLGIQIDKTKDDEGIFIWKSEEWIPKEELGNLIRILEKAQEELEDE
jgi:hypothetical protein